MTFDIDHKAADGAGTILLLGAGRMGGAMLRGWLAQGVPASAISVADPSPAPDLVELAARTGVRLNPADRKSVV